ncbi:MAG: sensor histidine kinase [Tsuneonella sp.]
MIARLFEHRSGRIIALCRVVLAFVFFIAMWLDPAQPVREAQLGYTLLGGYLLFAAVMLAVALRSWWFDHRLAWPALAIDVSAFLASVYFTESVADDFTSPFLAFFAFLMLAATIRWDWRVTAATAALSTVLYLAIGLVMVGVSIDFDVQRFGRRVTYMIVLALILIWFGLQRREQHIGRFTESPGAAEKPLPPLEEALAFALGETGAPAGVIAWCESEEPSTELRSIGFPLQSPSAGPEDFSSEAGFGSRARLFSADRRRKLEMQPGQRPRASEDGAAEPLADSLGIGEALALPMGGVTGRGEVLLLDIPGVCSDHVDIGHLVAREIVAAFDRHSTLIFSRANALARAQDALARDLHDSVAQSLAGAALRLEGLRNWIRAGNDPDPEILQLKSALRAEQAQVRGMINRLREGSGREDDLDLRQGAERLLGELGERWGITIERTISKEVVPVPAALAHDVYYLLREAVANAVRHGRARRIAVELAMRDSSVMLNVHDNGTGFAPDVPHSPRSIKERVERNSGRLQVATGPSGTSLAILLPLGSAA